VGHRRDRSLPCRTFRLLRTVLLAGYPLLGVAYLSDRLGALIEPVFLLCFSAALITELLEGEGSGTGATEPEAR
jgi:hypothetical protein